MVRGSPSRRRRLYAQFKAQLKNKLSPEQYYRFFYALGDFSDPAGPANSGLDPDAGSAGTGHLPAPGHDENPQRRIAWEFMRQHYDEI